MIDLYHDRPDLYDLLHDSMTADLLFYGGMVGAFVPAHGQALELGCGSGRVMKALLERGLQVTGLDSEPAMLERARHRLSVYGARATLVQGDMTRPDLGDKRFDLIVIAANTFMHLEDHAAQRACLSAIRDLLNDDGLALIDLANPFHMLNMPQLVLTVRRHIDDEKSGTQVTVSGVLDIDPTIPRVVDTLYIDEMVGGFLRRQTTSVELRLVFMPEFELLLTLSGLGIADAYGDYDLGPYQAQSERMIAVVRRL